MTTPAEHLRAEMAARGWAQRDLAERVGRSQPFISRVLRGQYPIGPALALDLEAAQIGTAEDWCRRQADYNLALVRASRASGACKVCEGTGVIAVGARCPDCAP